MNGDADGAVAALLDHYRLTTSLCMARFGEDGTAGTAQAKGTRRRG